MSPDPATSFALASSATFGLALASQTGLKAWRAWLDLKRLQLGTQGRRRSDGTTLADLRERVRHLEAIAAGAER